MDFVEVKLNTLLHKQNKTKITTNKKIEGVGDACHPHTCVVRHAYIRKDNKNTVSHLFPLS